VVVGNAAVLEDAGSGGSVGGDVLGGALVAYVLYVDGCEGGCWSPS